jgi:hypothetical protein
MNIDPRDAIKGVTPRFEHMTELERRGLGRWVGGFVDRWDWDSRAVERLSDEDALRVYAFLKAV